MAAKKIPKSMFCIGIVSPISVRNKIKDVFVMSLFDCSAVDMLVNVLCEYKQMSYEEKGGIEYMPRLFTAVKCD